MNKNLIKLLIGLEFFASLALEIYLILKARKFLKKQKSSTLSQPSSGQKNEQMVWEKIISLKKNNVININYIRNTNIEKTSSNSFYKTTYYKIWCLIQEFIQEVMAIRREKELFFPRKKNLVERMPQVIAIIVLLIMFYHLGYSFYLQGNQIFRSLKTKEKSCFFFPSNTEGDRNKTTEVFSSEGSDRDLAKANAGKKENSINPCSSNSYILDSKVNSKSSLENFVFSYLINKHGDVSKFTNFRKSSNFTNRVFQTTSYFDLISNSKYEKDEIKNLKEINYLVKEMVKKIFLFIKKNYQNKDSKNYDIDQIFEFLCNDLYYMDEISNFGQLFDDIQILNNKSYKNKKKPDFFDINDSKIQDSESYQYETYIEFIIDQFFRCF